MAGESVARRYARAILEIALEHRQSLDDWLADLQTIQSLVSDPSIHAVLVTPKLRLEQKLSAIEQVAGTLDPMRRNFLYLLIDRHRVDLIGAIAREFRHLVNEQKGIVEAKVTTAVPISDEEAERVANRLSQIVGKQVVLDRTVDPAIIGGIVARVGDKLINGSVAGRLAALRSYLQ